MSIKLENRNSIVNVTGWIRSLGIVSLMCFFAASCGTKEEPKKTKKVLIKKAMPKITPLVKQPLSNISIGFQEVLVDADSGKTFSVSNAYGSTVEVPTKVFTDSLGNLISGKVLLKYREMHTMNDMFLTGIPLSYDAAGMLKRFNSAGMFELRAYQNNKPVYLDSGKVIRVNMASFESSEAYHAFYLDENKTRNWIYLKDLKGTMNPAKKKIMRKAMQKVDAFKVPFEGNYFAFNYMALLDVYLNDKTVEIKKMRNDLTLQGKIKDYGVTWTNVYCYQSIEFNGTKTLASLLLWRKMNKEPWPVWGNSATCNITPGTNGTYQLELTQAKGKGYYKATIQPFFPIKSLLAFSPSYWQNKYNLAVRKAINEEMRKQKVADVFQALEVHNFGTYNIDKLQQEEDYVQIALEPEFDTEISPVNDIAIYYINEDYRTVIKYPRGEWGNITLLYRGGGKLFTVLPGNKIAMAEGEELNKLRYDELKQHPGTRVAIRFNTLNLPMNTIGEIANALGIQALPL